jgi:hypothetical protein
MPYNFYNFSDMLNRSRLADIFGRRQIFGQPEPTYEGSYNPSYFGHETERLPEEATTAPSYLDQFKRAMSERPVREEPSMKRKIFSSILGGVAALGNQGAAGGQRVNRSIREGPYLRKMEDWEGRTEGLAKLADIETSEGERTYKRGMDERKMRVDEDQLRVQREGVDVSRRSAESNIRMDDAQIAKIQNDITSGASEYVGEANGSFWVRDKKTGAFNEYKSGGMTDQQKSAAQQKLMQMQLDAGRYADRVSPDEQNKLTENAIRRLTLDPDAMKKYGKFINTETLGLRPEMIGVDTLPANMFGARGNAQESDKEHIADRALYDELRRIVGLGSVGRGGGNTNAPAPTGNDRVTVEHPTEKNADGTPKRGTIPRSDLASAIAQGYKEVK